MDKVLLEKNDVLNAIHEIRSLRQQNAMLGAQVRVLDILERIVRIDRSEGASLDIAWQLERALKASPNDK